MSHQQVKEFMQAFGQATPDTEVAKLDEATKALRYELIREELQELQESDTIIAIADALSDLKYVIHGTSISYGMEIQDLVFNTEGIPYYFTEEEIEETQYQLGLLLDTLRFALEEDDNDRIGGALAGMIMVINEMSLDMNLDIRACVDEVHNSNMSKLGVDGFPIYRDDGKVLKGPNYFAPNLNKVLYEI